MPSNFGVPVLVELREPITYKYNLAIHYVKNLRICVAFEATYSEILSDSPQSDVFRPMPRMNLVHRIHFVDRYLDMRYCLF